VDWSAAEFGIAAKLSEDPVMLSDYLTGDPHMEFAKAAGAVPSDATKASHGAERERFKSCNFGILYGMGQLALARRVGDDCSDPEAFAGRFMADHKRRYRLYWEWSELVQDHAMLCGGLQTMFGWHVHSGKGSDVNPRSMRNFPIQAGCAEIMRVAACLATERGLPVCAPVHDAFLICSPIDRIEADVAAMQACMNEASGAALGGFTLGTDEKTVRYPDRYMDRRGITMWNTVMDILEGRYGRKIA
jgi:DNA polymerase-1